MELSLGGMYLVDKNNTLECTPELAISEIGLRNIGHKLSVCVLKWK
jgi:hypothetical protein